jgi:hypothetical protein
MAHILIIGQSTSRLREYLTTNKHSFTTVQDRLKTQSVTDKETSYILADFSSKDTILNSLSQLKATPDGVMVIYERYVLPAAQVAAHLHLPGISEAAAEACTDKFIMRSLFAKAPEKVSPDFDIIQSEENVISFAGTHSFPLILKPTNLAKSLLVTKNDSIEELIANYRKSTQLLQSAYNKYSPNRQPTLIVEEYLDGTIHSVDAFVDSDGDPHVLKEIVDYQTGYDIGYDDNFHYSRILPSALDSRKQLSLIQCAKVGIKALGMSNTAAHVEIIMTVDGPRIVEIGARNGGYRDRMHSISNGIDITGAALQIARGIMPNIASVKNEPCAVLELFPKQPGIFVEITNVDTLKTLPSLSYFSVKYEPGNTIGKSSDGYKMTAVIILHNNDSNQFKRDLQYVNNNVFVRTN